MGNTRNGHAWSLYTSNKTHELASRIPELALMSQGAEELFVTLAYCRYILQPIFVESKVNWSNRHAIKPGIKILNPKLYPPITNACTAQKTASGNVNLHWLAVRNFTRFNFPRRRSQLKYKHKLPHLTLILAVALFFPPPPPPPRRGTGEELYPIRRGSARKWYLFQTSDK